MASWGAGWSGGGSWGGGAGWGGGSSASYVGGKGAGAGTASLGYGAWGGGGAGKGKAGGKGDSGKGGAPANYNVPGLPKTQIEGLPSNGVVVYRGDTGRLMDFCEALKAQVDEYEWGECTFENIDVSQVQWSTLDFTVLVELLQEKGASTKRLKAFKCGLDDDALKAVAAWLEQLPAESMPHEVHLSHSKITQEGFEAVFQVLEAKRAELSSPVPPVWFRVEQSQVPVPYLHELAEQGKVQFVQRIGMRTVGEAVIAMPSYCSGPDSKPPNSQGGQQGYNNSGSHGKGAAGGNGGGASQWSGGGWQQQRQTAWAGQGQATSRTVVPARVVPVNTSPWAQAQGGVPAAFKPGTLKPGTAVQRQDRSRTPAPPPKPTKEPQKPKLPPGWEEHWSDEYQIPYYWHKDTGESMWEVPK